MLQEGQLKTKRELKFSKLLAVSSCLSKTNYLPVLQYKYRQELFTGGLYSIFFTENCKYINMREINPTG